MKHKHADLKALTENDISSLMQKRPVIINHETCGFLWRTARVGCYIPVLVNNGAIDWDSVNLKEMKWGSV